MATSHRFRRTARSIAIAVAALALTTVPGTGYAEPTDPPPTAADVQRQAIDLNARLEVVTEDYLQAQIVLSQRQADAMAAQAELGAVRGRLAELDSQVRVVAVNAYKGDQLASFTVMMSSGSPEEFLDRLNTLDAISRHSNGVLAELSDTQLQAADLAAEAQAALTAAARTEAELAGKKAIMEAELPRLEALLASLSESERQAAFAAHAGGEQPSPADAGGGQAEAPAGNGPAEAPATTPSGPIDAPTEAAQIAVDTVYAQLGDPYLWGGAGPDSFDCSGLTMFGYAAAGISLPHSSRMQATMGVAVSRDQLLPGDLVYFGNPVYHIATYIGNGQMITAPQTGDVVKIQNIDVMDYAGARRIATG